MGKVDVYQIVTDKIIKSLEEGTVPWLKPWSVETHKNLASKYEYKGINQLLCEVYMMENEWSDPYWLSYKGAKSLGGNVKKGEKANIVILWKPMIEDEGTDDEHVWFLLRYYNVFNVAQCEDIELPDRKSDDDFDPNDEAEKLLKGMPKPPKLVHGGNRASYSPPKDEVHMPKMGRFLDIDSLLGSDSYYCVRFHELVHSTGHTSRLNRKEVMSEIKFGSENYSQEELVAELGAAMLAGVCGLNPSNLERSASYIESWRKKLTDDKKIVVHAAKVAAKAADYIRDIQPEKKDKEK